jgi:hypothetical protein
MLGVIDSSLAGRSMMVLPWENAGGYTGPNIPVKLRLKPGSPEVITMPLSV